MFQCCECDETFAFIAQLLKHFKYEHKIQSHSASITCKQDSCLREYQNISAFKKHLKSKHNNEGSAALDKTFNETIANNNALNECDDVMDIDGTNDESNEIYTHVTASQMEEAVESCAAQFLSKMHSSNNVNRQTVQDIVNGMDDLFLNGFLGDLKDDVTNLLKKYNVPSEEIERVNTNFNICSDPFKNLNTEHLRLKYFESKKLYAPPIEYTIGKRYGPKKVKGKTVMTDIPHTGQYMDIKQTLKNILSISGSLDAIRSHMTELETENDVIKNLIQGENWKKKISAMGDKIVLPLLLYYDDFGINNQLGGHKDKIGGVYFTIACMPQHLQSQLENLFIALLFKSQDRVDFKNEATFAPLINDLILLENEGILIEQPNGENVTVHFCLAQVIGDNLGLHSILGFVESFSANYYCRYCKAHKSEMRKMTRANSNLRRTKTNYDIDLSLFNVSMTGINSNSPFNDIPSFHVIDNIACDIMHDLFEGVCRYTMSKIILLLIEMGFFTLADLNERIKYFDYGRIEETNKPPPILLEKLHNDNLGFSASEMLFFMRYFGIIIGDLIPEGNKIWDVYLSLRKIIDIVMLRSISKQQIAALDTLITEFLEDVIYTLKIQLKPKFHFLVHYCEIINLIGPPINYWCMRFEGKHRDSKSASNIIACRKNPAKSLAIKQQLKVSHKLLSKKGFATSNVDHGVGKLIDKHDYIFDEIACESILYEVSWVKINGTKYETNYCLVFGIDEFLNPKFLVINKLFITNSKKVYIKYYEISTIGQYSHIHAFEVLIPTQKTFKFAPFTDLQYSTDPSIIRQFYDECSYIVMRNAI